MGGAVSKATAIRLDTSDLNSAVAALGRKFPEAMRRAFKKTGVAARTEMARLVSADMALPVRKVRDEIKLTSDETSATLTVRGYRIPLIDFKARGPEPSRGRGAGVSYNLPAGRGRLPHAFIATMPSGHRGVFERTGRFGAKKGVRGGGTRRETIAEKFGPSIAVVFSKFMPEGAARASEVLEKNVQTQINLAMQR